MATPTACYICHNTWLGKGPVCDDCMYLATYGTAKPPPPPPICAFCAGAHETVDCLAAALHYQQQATHAAQVHMSTRPRRPRRPRPFTNYTFTPAMARCPACKGNYLIESKAGSVCTSCHTVCHGSCRSCTSENTRGLKSNDGTQFIECNDCQYIE